MLRAFLTAVVLIGLSGPAFASECEKMIHEVDAYLAQHANVDASAKEKAMHLRDEGDHALKAGHESDCLHDLQEAKKILHMN